MGYVEVSDTTKLWYEIRPTTSTEPRPWLLVTHPSVADVTFIAHILDDPDIQERFNVIAFDNRSCGRTKADVLPTCDLWMLASDLARALHLLQIPPVHVLGTQAWLSEVVLRLAVLYPDRVQSLSLCGMVTEVEDRHLQAFSECTEVWSNPADAEEWDEAVSAIQFWLYGPPDEFDCDTLDRWVASVIRRYPPSASLNVLGHNRPFIQRFAIPDELIAEVDIPMMVMIGDKDAAYSVEEGEDRARKFTSVPGGVEVIVIEGGPNHMAVTHWEQVKHYFLDFVDHHITRADPSSQRPALGDFQASLNRLARIAGDESVKLRDPNTTSSFYALPPDVVAANAKLDGQCRELQTTKFSLLGGNSKEFWEDAAFEEQVPFRFSTRFEHARM